MFRWLLLLLVLAAVVVGLVVGVLNPHPVTVDLALVQFSMPQGALLLVALGLGVLLGLVLALVMFVIPARMNRPRAVAARSGERGLTRSGND